MVCLLWAHRMICILHLLLLISYLWSWRVIRCDFIDKIYIVLGLDYHRSLSIWSVAKHSPLVQETVKRQVDDNLLPEILINHYSTHWTRAMWNAELPSATDQYTTKHGRTVKLSDRETVQVIILFNRLVFTLVKKKLDQWDHLQRWSDSGCILAVTGSRV